MNKHGGYHSSRHARPCLGCDVGWCGGQLGRLAKTAKRRLGRAADNILVILEIIYIQVAKPRKWKRTEKRQILAMKRQRL